MLLASEVGCCQPAKWDAADQQSSFFASTTSVSTSSSTDPFAHLFLSYFFFFHTYIKNLGNISIEVSSGFARSSGFGCFLSTTVCYSPCIAHTVHNIPCWNVGVSQAFYVHASRVFLLSAVPLPPVRFSFR